MKFAWIVLISFSLMGCLSWDVNDQSANAVDVNPAENNEAPAALDEELAEEDIVEEDLAEAEEPNLQRKGFVPDPNDPLNGPEFRQAIRSDDPYYAPVYPNDMAPSQTPTGGIYQTRMGDIFFGDHKASQVGDILTINLREATTSTKSNEATITKAASATIENPTVLGQELNLDTTLPQQDTNFAGNASANQNNSLNGTISVTVFRVFPNGVLAVRGEKWLQLNQGNEFIRFSGLVRKQDISPNNTVESERVADARIIYSGTGDIAAGSEQGWVSRLLNSSAMPY